MVVVASDNVSFLDSWAAALGGHGTLIRRVRQLDEVEGTLSGRQPAVLLIDLALRDLNGAPGVAELIAFSPSTRIIAMGHQPSDDEGIAVLRAGARGYCNVHIDPRLLVKAVETVQLGEVWIGRRLIDRLACRRLLGGFRGPPAADLDSLAEAVARFSVLATALGHLIDEMDVNPIIAGPSGALAVDALIVPRPSDPR